jgi:hypothetical protein
MTLVVRSLYLSIQGRSFTGRLNPMHHRPPAASHWREWSLGANDAFYQDCSCVSMLPTFSRHFGNQLALTAEEGSFFTNLMHAETREPLLATIRRLHTFPRHSKGSTYPVSIRQSLELLASMTREKGGSVIDVIKAGSREHVFALLSANKCRKQGNFVLCKCYSSCTFTNIV